MGKQNHHNQLQRKTNALAEEVNGLHLFRFNQKAFQAFHDLRNFAKDYHYSRS